MRNNRQRQLDAIRLLIGPGRREQLHLSERCRPDPPVDPLLALAGDRHQLARGIEQLRPTHSDLNLGRLLTRQIVVNDRGDRHHIPFGHEAGSLQPQDQILARDDAIDPRAHPQIATGRPRRRPPGRQIVGKGHPRRRPSIRPGDQIRLPEGRVPEVLPNRHLLVLPLILEVGQRRPLLPCSQLHQLLARVSGEAEGARETGRDAAVTHAVEGPPNVAAPLRLDTVDRFIDHPKTHLDSARRTPVGIAGEDRPGGGLTRLVLPLRGDQLQLQELVARRHGQRATVLIHLAILHVGYAERDVRAVTLADRNLEQGDAAHCSITPDVVDSVHLSRHQEVGILGREKRENPRRLARLVTRSIRDQADRAKIARGALRPAIIPICRVKKASRRDDLAIAIPKHRFDEDVPDDRHLKERLPLTLRIGRHLGHRELAPLRPKLGVAIAILLPLDLLILHLDKTEREPRRLRSPLIVGRANLDPRPVPLVVDVALRIGIDHHLSARPDKARLPVDLPPRRIGHLRGQTVGVVPRLLFIQTRNLEGDHEPPFSIENPLTIDDHVVAVTVEAALLLILLRLANSVIL